MIDLNLEEIPAHLLPKGSKIGDRVRVSIPPTTIYGQLVEAQYQLEKFNIKTQTFGAKKIIELPANYPSQPDAPTQIIIEIPEAAPLLNKLLRMHWRKRRQIQERFAWLMRQSLGYTPKKPIQYCTVVIERHSAGLPDWDNLYGSVKIILDCLVKRTKTNPHGLGLIEDDNPNVIRSLQATPCQAKRGEQKTIIRIFDIGEVRDGKV